MGTSQLRLLLISTFLCFCYAWDYNQNQYVLRSHRLVLDYYNPKFFKYFRFFNTKFNRTVRSFRVEYEALMEYDTDFYVIVQGYKLIDNTYKKLPAIRFKEMVCQALETNALGLGDIFKANNVSTKCPVPTGVVVLKDFVPNGFKFPPLIPLGDYKFTFENSNDIGRTLTYSWFGSIEKPIKH